MKNKGLLTQRRTIPLGFVKDPAPVELPNQRFAEDVSSGSASEPVAQVENTPESPKGEAQRPAAKTRRRVGKEASQRYTVKLELDQNVVAELDLLLTGLTGEAKTAAKRKIVRDFLAKALTGDLKARPYTPKSGVLYRIDIVVSDARKDAILKAESANPFEPIATVLGRHLAPRFADFVLGLKASLGR